MMINNNKIIGVGIDSVEILRMQNWKNLPKNKLLRIFSNEEIEYCLKSESLCAERFAARFAAKEAAYKALALKISFIKFCKHIQTRKVNSVPKLMVSWDKLDMNDNINTFISITHTKSTATAIVIFQEKN